MHIDKKRYTILMLIICFIISVANGIFYYRFRALYNQEGDLYNREEVLAREKNTLSEDIETLNKDKEELIKMQNEVEAREEILKNKEEEIKVKEKEFADKEKGLKDKEEAIKQKEEELKEKEADLEKKLLANRPKNPESSRGDMVAYLTFDDGPSVNTERILDILEENNMKATFFVNGRIGFENTYLRIVNEGHKIGNHTYSHNYGEVYESEESFINSVNQLNDYLALLGISKPDIIRFPGGSNNTVSYGYGGEELMDRLVNEVVIEGYDYFDWNVSSGDANKSTEDKSIIMDNVKKGCVGKTNPVILFHDSAPKTTTADGLQEIIDYLREQGYSFGTLENGIGVKVKFK